MKGEVDLRVGNRARVAALEIGDFELTLPSGLIILLKNCYYTPAMSRNIISVSCLDMDGFVLLLGIVLFLFIVKICFMAMRCLVMVFTF